MNGPRFYRQQREEERLVTDLEDIARHLLSITLWLRIIAVLIVVVIGTNIASLLT